MFRSPGASNKFKAVIEVGAYKEPVGAEKLIILGTPDTSPLLREALRQLGVELADREARIGSRNYTLAPWIFTARYESRGKPVWLVAGASLADAVSFNHEIVNAGSYALLNGDSQPVERGTVRTTGAGSQLVPALVHTHAAFTPEQRAKELRPAITAAAYVPSGPEDFSFVDGIASGMKMFFIGESPHHDLGIWTTVTHLSLHLRRDLGYGVMGWEADYSAWPFMEAQSMGDGARLANVLPAAAFSEEKAANESIVAYNRSVPAEKRLLCTALDIDHAICNKKTRTVLYLGHLAAGSSSNETKSDLAKAIPALLDLKRREETHAYLDDLERRFRAAWSSFSPQDQEEIAFTLSLERASIDYEILGPETEGMEEVRRGYFRQTIERAFAKAQASNAPLICYVGGAHAQLNEPGPGDVQVKITEARYFEREYRPSKGRVASILIQRIGEMGHHNGSLETAALALMGDRDRLFVNLRNKSWAAVKNLPGEFFSQHQAKYDGVLFIK